MFEFNSQTATAIARLVVTVIATCAATFGWTFDAETWFNIALSIVALALLGYTWWKNNNVTYAAQEAQKVLDSIKRNEFSGKEGTE